MKIRQLQNGDENSTLFYLILDFRVMAPFTMSNVTEAMFSINGIQAPGTMSFVAIFTRATGMGCWDVLEPEP